MSVDEYFVFGANGLPECLHPLDSFTGHLRRHPGVRPPEDHEAMRVTQLSQKTVESVHLEFLNANDVLTDFLRLIGKPRAG